MIAIIDYQMGNLRSVQKGFEQVGHSATITASSDEILNADHVVLPGVGAFEDAMHELSRRGLVDTIRTVVEQDKPFLGICLGLQLLFDTGEEGGTHQGLGILPGQVKRFDVPDGYKVPHMGWNQARIRQPAPILKDVQDGSHFYFVHSYYVAPTDPSVVAIEAEYHTPFCAMVWNGKNLFATQFHPEKSQEDGLSLLKNFAEL